MRNVWSCSPCVALLVSALFGDGAASSHAVLGRQRKDVIHRIAKAQVTAVPLFLERRDESSCPVDYSLCPASLSGGCCPSQYACASDSCFATTAGPTTGCGKPNYFNCGANDAGGCCPVGYVCGPTDCTAPAGVSNTFTSCPNSYYLCPSSYNFGCCRNGMGCALNACYSTDAVTSILTQTVTTTANGVTITSTTTALTVGAPTPPTGLPSSDPNVAPKLIPSTVLKWHATSPAANVDSGLTRAQLGGIVGGAVALLLAVITAAILIIRRLKQVEETMESKKGSSSGPTKTQSHAQMEHYGRQLHISPSDMDNVSIDPLMATPNTTNNNSGMATPQLNGMGETTRGRSNSDNFSQAPNGHARDTSADMNLRQASMDSSGPGYFDIPARVQNVPGARQPMSVAAMRTSTDSHSTQGQYGQYAYTHYRQQSDASELSAHGSDSGGGMVSPQFVPELDSSGAYVELPGAEHNGNRSRSSSIAAASPRTSFSHSRRRSDGANGPRPDGPATGTGFGPLGVVNESAEIHGYYGPSDQQAGQTSAGLNIGWDISSPIGGPGLSPGRQGPPPPPQPQPGPDGSFPQPAPHSPPPPPRWA
ncbi:hypothetical protein B0T19DRAFT_265366 [Cercophora scortea]|uniref:Uncharacterized protein n=1 Tax=Cercophora scortea TaxID=314031 RepID=A0AAE0IAC6_9PEZI|nr:hypothetical protein B0T19DRAFT_265366 [Cercophora scortea]